MKNRFEIRDDCTAFILVSPLGVTLETLIDTAKLPLAMQITGSWVTSYAPSIDSYYCIGFVEGHTVCLHRLLMRCPKGLEVDHINHNTLDNRSCNLRLANRSENMQNRAGANHNNLSGIRGVYWEKERGLWRAEVRVGSVRARLGRFSSLHDAEKAVKSTRARLMPFSKEAMEVSSA